MKKYIPLFVFLAFVSFANLANASVLYSQSISLSPGWNIVSTPKVLESHAFSLPETSDNFDIYVLNASSTTGWSTLADLGQTEFVPLYGYFIKNKSASEQTLIFNFKDVTSPQERLFERSFSKAGWYSIGISNPTYSKDVYSNTLDTNNPSNILSLLSGNYDTVIDFTDTSSVMNKNSLSLGDLWKSAIPSDINNLRDFRETKAYAVYIKNTDAKYIGFQNNNIPVVPDSATLTISTNTASPSATTVIASAGANQDEADKVTGLVFNVKAENDSILINNVTVSATGSAVEAGNITTAYLFDGSTEIDNATVGTTTGNATFSNLDFIVSEDSTKTFTVKFDVRNASATAREVTFSVEEDAINAKNTVGDSITASYISGSVTGEPLMVQKAGVVYSLVGTPTFTKTAIGNTASSSYLATFNFTVSAQGTDITVATSDAFVVGIYLNNVQVTTASAVYSKPTSGVTGTDLYTIADGSTATFTVEYSFTAPSDLYTSGIANVRLESATTNAGTVTYISDTFRTGSQTI
jgi:hypothetical protein